MKTAQELMEEAKKIAESADLYTPYGANEALEELLSIIRILAEKE